MSKLITLGILLFLFFYYFFVQTPQRSFSSAFPELNYNPYNKWYIEKDPGSFVDHNDYRQQENNRQKTLPSAYSKKKRAPPRGGVSNPNESSSLGLTGLPPSSAPINLNTNFEDAPDGKIHFLDRHNIQCPSNKILNSFKLTEGDGNKVRFDYNCISGVGANSKGDRGTVTPAKYTKYTDGNGNLNSLLKQSVTCGDGFLNNLQMERDPSGTKIRYKYRCSSINKTNPTKKGTGFQNGDKLTSLMKHNVQCSLKNGLSGFGLEKNDQNQFQYNYECSGMA